jgi:Fur family ferric uptake transcriptional regulator
MILILGSLMGLSSPAPRREPRSLAAVRATLAGLDRAVSAQELYRLLYDQGSGLGLASIYRALDHLVASGEAERLRRAGEDAYVLCPASHHHHAICRECGRVDVAECDLAETAPATTESGFQIDAHQTVYYGRCPRCLVAPGRDKRS